MQSTHKSTAEILQKLGIEALNPMQLETEKALAKNTDLVLLSPTGTGKTIAFLLPIVAQLNPEIDQTQVAIVVPSRELALQIEQVLREMGTGFKANAVYGGRAISQDKIDLKHPPTVLIGTPGRIADHLRRETIGTEFITTLVLDEFDKSLEIGFEDEMREILFLLPQLKRRILTSATHEVQVPDFVGLKSAKTIDYSKQSIAALQIKTIESTEKDKLRTLGVLLKNLGNQPGIVFCNFKETINRVSEYLSELGVPHGCFYGGMEQKDRERALIKFRNGTYQLIIATDLAARGLDVPEITFIIHYHLPLKSAEFTHRNGRTARMHANGTAYVLKWVNEDLPDFISAKTIAPMPEANLAESHEFTTLFVSGGRRDKISKGDIAGLFLKHAQLEPNQVGDIELKQDCAFVAVEKSVVEKAIAATNNVKLKQKKVRVYEV